MAEITLLIGKTDIIPYAQISISARDEQMLHPHILSAQIVDIKPVLGNALMTDILANPTNYELLLEGGTYVKDTITYSFQGLKASISCFAYARYLIGKNAIDSPFGVVAKSSEYSEQADAKIIASNVSSFKNTGATFLSECIRYIKDNESTYPLYYESEGKQERRPTNHKLPPISRI